MKKKNVENVEKLREYMELTGVIKDTVDAENRDRICLNNYTLRTLAGYTEDSTEDNFNQYVKDYIDKLSFDEHNRKVEVAKEANDKEKLQELSNEVMKMAGYIGSDTKSKKYNKYAKSFVDRTLLDRQYNILYKAIRNGDKETIDAVYKKIYSMTSYSENRPYGVVNEYAQTFVDRRIDKFIKRGIHIPDEINQDRGYAI